MSSAYSITVATNPPRAVYLDFPLGHTSGRPHDRKEQLAIMRDTFAAFKGIATQGSIVSLNYRWAEDDAWKDGVMRAGSDNRVERHETPQYQSQDDEAVADAECKTCVWT